MRGNFEGDGHMKKKTSLVIFVLFLGIVVVSWRSSRPRDFELKLLYTTNTESGTDGMFEARNNSADAAMCIDVFWEKDAPKGSVDYLGSGGLFPIPAKSAQTFSTMIPTNSRHDRLVMAVLPAVTRYGRGPMGWARNRLVRLSRPIPDVAWRLAGGARCQSESVGPPGN